MRYLRLFLYTLYRFDWLLILAVLLLSAISFSAIYSIDLSRSGGLTFIPIQLIALGLGVGAMVVLGSFHVTFYQAAARLSYLGALLLLVLVLFFGVTVRGTTGWFDFGPIAFQPSEFAKVCLIIFLGYTIARSARRTKHLRFLVQTGLPTALYVGLVLLQPDLGSALVISGIWFVSLLFAGVPKRFIIGILLLGLVAFGVGWNTFFAEYQKDRIRTFLAPEADALGSGYNVTQSLIAIGSGGLYGRGLGFGSQSQLHFLPEAQTDFIFSVIAEELGFLGAVLMLVLYILIFWRLIRIAGRSPEDFGAYMVSGIAAMLLLQIVFNVGAATALLPVTGLTLPFMSYGGSSLVINFVLIGLAQSVARSAHGSDVGVVVGEESLEALAPEDGALRSS